jgi:hypothetical protein
MNSSNKKILDQLVADHCCKLFADYKLEIRTGECAVPVDERFLLCGILGFTSQQMRGALVLATTKEPLQRTSPVANPSHRDWICELVNQLLGRIKNQLLTRGVEIFPSTPVSLRGEYLSPVLQQRLIAELFIADGGVVCVWMDCEFDADFVLAEETTGDASALAEGESLLF